MGLARKLEQRLEQLVDGLSATLFRGGMHPVELAGRVVRQADLLVTETDLGPTIPNRFDVRVNPKDLVDDLDPVALDREVTRTLTATAAERGWRTSGPIRVAITTDPTVTSGSIGCEARVLAGPMPAWAQLIDMGGAGAFELCDNRVIVGRASSADVTLQQPEISRRHAVVYRRSGGIWIVDLGSANGSWVNGRRVDGDPVAVHAGDQLTFGPATLSLRLV